jgi:hypothetical protein
MPVQPRETFAFGAERTLGKLAGAKSEKSKSLRASLWRLFKFMYDRLAEKTGLIECHCAERISCATAVQKGIFGDQPQQRNRFPWRYC